MDEIWRVEPEGPVILNRPELLSLNGNASFDQDIVGLGCPVTEH